MKKNTNKKDIGNFAILNQLGGMLDCSLARYLVNARPWRRRPYLLLDAIARRMAVEHEHYAGEIIRLLHARGHSVNSHTYSMEFSYYNNLSLEYLAPRLLDHQHRLATFANDASKGLKGDYEVQRLLGRLFASLRKYGSLLEELLARHRLAPSKSSEDRPAPKIAGRAANQVKRKGTASTESQTAA